MIAKPHFRRQLLHPKYWLTWLGFGIWWLVSQLPYGWQMALGKGLGHAMQLLAKRRVAIAARNIELCFPELTAAQRRQLVGGVMDSVGKAFFEIGIAWFMPKPRFMRLFEVEGLAHLRAAQAAGQGVLLMGMHFTHLDLSASLVSSYHSIDASYRPHQNPVYDYVQRKGRERHAVDGHVIARGDVRAMVRALKGGRAVWYAPDQDYGREHSIFVPFFDVPAATITATAQFARMGKALVIPFMQVRKADGSGYKITVFPPLSEFPSGDDVADAVRINKVVEDCIRLQPDQYLWVHRRFKTRPPGEPDLYTSVGIAPGTRT